MLGEPLRELLSERTDVFATLTERWDLQGHGVATYLTLKRPALETKRGGRDVNLAIGVGSVGAYGTF